VHFEHARGDHRQKRAVWVVVQLELSHYLSALTNFSIPSPRAHPALGS
jgi:hypothetical protein